MTHTIASRLYFILDWKRDKRYRKGILQGFRFCDGISQAEWESLFKQVNQGVKRPRVMVKK